ncbi:double-strand break repair helicase AddA [Pseudovibrio sp. SPO723]|uniref:double-strand break repair helicase AddA n=1 Tax=Nesiotobacter zosterae TaxID=392721 RepID=UPI0029C27D47|nr:double-strand break repair helicase AddA [Pseudovibrio sp. SPO723]MDX5592121.1 double-strand break repair helicase AddA [Pseudovibrio sp. SPO723]
MQIPAKTLESQAKAAHPLNSAWVSANAGSGKTFVLARRVIRLLLNGTDPSRILCLTFTKAAAAEMATRVFDILASWTSLSDAELTKELEVIEGRPPEPTKVSEARRLFARALETPGGLKIQTIHAFCEALLHQFPLEANVAGHFSVLDDRIADELLSEARARVLHRAEVDPDTDLGQALALLIELLPDAGVESALSELIGKRDAFYRWIVAAGSLENALGELIASFGLTANDTPEAIDAAFKSECLLSSQEVKAYAEALRTGTKTDQGRADAMLATLAAPTDEVWRRSWLDVFLTQKMEPRKSLGTKKIQEGFPHVIEHMMEEQQRLLSLLEKRAAVITVAGTKAILHLSDAVLQHYEKDKIQRGFLDFEDLVVRAANLLSRSDAARWVQYKLDQGLDHILVDEAQDTSPRQWEVIGALAEEFFAGEGARAGVRTIFAVGDEKQSIYSFQGAVPAYFAQMRDFFKRRAGEAQKTFEAIELNLSFRSTPDVLGAVDKVFEVPEAYAGLSQDNLAPVHEAIRRNDPGLVEIWPLEEHADIEEPEDWTEPVDRIGSSNPMMRLARRIAGQIRDWDDNGVASPGDVLVLVRKRGPFVDALNRELKRLDVPAAGADRLTLTDHIAVQDLVALGRFILLAEDDMSLACTLKSPLFGLSDDDLFEIAHETPGRPRPGTLWQMLVKKADSSDKWAAIRSQLEDWRDRADFVPPFEFYARILGADGHRLNFRRRLGSEVDDVLDEFLALTITFEQTGTPGLEGFLAWLAAAPTEIKRELNNAKGMVRIMTVHGSKGLEAPFVILADNCSAPVSAHHDPVMLEKARQNDDKAANALVWLPTSALRTPWHKEALQAMRDGQEEEYRRLLYVAMTRAKDRLVVCGWSPKRGPHANCWYSIIDRCLAAESRPQLDQLGNTIGLRWTRDGAEKEEPKLGGTKAEPVNAAVSLPAWVTRNVSAPDRLRRLKPSAAFEEMETKQGIEPPSPIQALEAARQPESWPLVRGRMVHRLLEILPELPETERHAAMERYIAIALPEAFRDREEDLRKDVLGVLHHPEYSALFTVEGQAEVPIQGLLKDEAGQDVEVSGIIDRLVLQGDELWIVDYKTNSQLPDHPSAVSEEYASQLAVYKKLLINLYPTKKIRGFLLYTGGPVLFEVPQERLDHFNF